jgi:hypothetical protein
MKRAVLAACLALAAGAKADPAGPLDQSFDKFVAALKDSGDFIKHHKFYQDPENRAAAMDYIAHMTIATLEEDVVQDADYPFFRIIDFRIREGGDNPDQRYLMAKIRGGETYRIWGHLGKQRRIDFQAYAGDPYIKGGGRVVSNLAMENVHFGPDGSFEVFLSAKQRPGDWMENAPDTSKILVRQIFSDWKNETAGDVHIDRVGYEGALKPRLTDAAMAEKLDVAASELLKTVKTWPEFVRARYVEGLPANTLPPPKDPSSYGGVKGRWMTEGRFDLADDEALIVTTWPTSANYQGIQLANLWFSSLEYANRQSSLSRDQAFQSSDGAYHFVIAAKDPGIQNWLDTDGMRQGIILLRYDGMKEPEFDKAKWPTIVKVKLADLRKSLAADTPAFSGELRTAQIAERRRHVQVRFGD